MHDIRPKYKLSRSLLGFGMLKEEDNWDNYPTYPHIQEMIDTNKISISYVLDN